MYTKLNENSTFPIIPFIEVLCVCSVAQLCPTLCDPMDYSLPGFSVHGILDVLKETELIYNRKKKSKQWLLSGKILYLALVYEVKKQDKRPKTD